MLNRIRIAILIVLAVLPELAFSADVVFLASPGTPSLALKTIELACQFYGLQLEKFEVMGGMGR